MKNMDSKVSILVLEINSMSDAHAHHIIFLADLHITRYVRETESEKPIIELYLNKPGGFEVMQDKSCL